MIYHELDCNAARTELSARLDGELAQDGALRAHLLGCEACRAHELELAALGRAFALLRAEEPARELWPRIERRAFPARAMPPLALRAAAALVGFLGLGAAAWLVERARTPAQPRHDLFERVAAPAPAPDALFAALPEYRLLTAAREREETR